MLRALALVALCAGTTWAQSVDTPSEPTYHPLWKAGVDGYHTYRIPALLVTSKGTVLAFCEGRKTRSSDHGDLDLLLKRSTDGGRTWSEQQIVYEEGDTLEITIGNPCPVEDRSTGTIWLPFTRDNDDVLVTFSTDEGATWSTPRDITADVKLPDWGWYATGPGVGIQIQHGPHAGRLVIPCDHKKTLEGKPNRTFSHCIYSDDHGKTWKLGEPVAPHTNECQVVEVAGGRLLINMRNYRGRDDDARQLANRRAIARSDDGGHSWTELAYDDVLVEPVCQASLLAHPTIQFDGQPLLLFSNPPHSTKREDLTVRLSRDGGRTWPAANQLHTGPSAYSSLTVLPDGSIGCLYEAGRNRYHESIIFARFPLSWLE
jgi:sialidase-1